MCSRRSVLASVTTGSGTSSVAGAGRLQATTSGDEAASGRRDGRAPRCEDATAAAAIQAQQRRVVAETDVPHATARRRLDKGENFPRFTRPRRASPIRPSLHRPAAIQPAPPRRAARAWPSRHRDLPSTSPHLPELLLARGDQPLELLHATLLLLAIARASASESRAASFAASLVRRGTADCGWGGFDGLSAEAGSARRGEVGEATGEDVDLRVTHADDARGHGVEEATIVRDQDDRPSKPTSASSRISAAGMSRWFVGSSRKRRFRGSSRSLASARSGTLPAGKAGDDAQWIVSPEAEAREVLPRGLHGEVAAHAAHLLDRSAFRINLAEVLVEVALLRGSSHGGRCRSRALDPRALRSSLSNVDFPAPFGPTMPMRSPRRRRGRPREELAPSALGGDPLHRARCRPERAAGAKRKLTRSGDGPHVLGAIDTIELLRASCAGSAPAWSSALRCCGE